MSRLTTTELRKHAVVLALAAALTLGVSMSSLEASQVPSSQPGEKKGQTNTSVQSATVRYQVADVERSIAFYTQRLGFRPVQKAGAAFASVSRGDLTLLRSGPGSSGSRPMPDGRRQEPGGWNRIVLYVDNLASMMKSLQSAGVRFRNQVESGPGGTQIQIEDPDGNPIEIHE